MREANYLELREDIANEDKRQLASLLSHPGYHLLLDLLDNRLLQLTESLEREQDPHKLISLVRIWQVTQEITKILKYTPQNMREELAAITGGTEFVGTNVPPELMSMALANARIRARRAEGVEDESI